MSTTTHVLPGAPSGGAHGNKSPSSSPRSAASTTSTAVSTDTRLKRHIGPIGLLFVAVGSIIGSGWLFGAMFAAEQAGPAAILSWVFGAIMILFIGLTYAELGTMFPMSGGVARYPHFAWGSFASYTNGWITWIAVASVAPVEVEAALQYANNYLPFLQRLDHGVPVLTSAGFVAALILLAIFCIINSYGIRLFTRINNVAVWWKLGVITIVVIALFAVGYHPGHIDNVKFGGFTPLGWNGVFSAIATAGVVFSYFGFRQGIDLAGETDNPQRNIPLSIIGSLVLCGIIYVLLQIAFIGTLPDAALAQGWAHIGTAFKGGVSAHDLAFGPMAALAGTIGLSWLMLLLYVDAFISPADTGFIYSMLTSRISYAMGRNGNAPKGLSKVNRHGAPWISAILAFFICALFLLPFPGWQKLVGFVTSATVLSFGTGPIIMMIMRKELPDQKRPFHLGGGWIVPFLAFFSSNIIVYWSGWDTDWKLMVVMVIGFILLAVHEGIYGKETPALDFRHGWWMLVWFAGLTLISWLGDFPAVSHHAGNLGLLNLGTSAIVTAIFSVFIMWLAYISRLHGQEVIDKINQRWDDEAAPAEAAPAGATPAGATASIATTATASTATASTATASTATASTAKTAHA